MMETCAEVECNRIDCNGEVACHLYLQLSDNLVLWVLCSFSVLDVIVSWNSHRSENYFVILENMA